MNNSKKTIISRRSRPAKMPLSQDIIIRTALSLLKKEGMPGLTMRKIAQALDTGPASLYVYVQNAQELQCFVLDYGLKEIALPDKKAGNWKERLIKLLYDYMRNLYDNPGLAELSHITVPIGTYSLNILEYILECLMEAGVGPIEAGWGSDLLLHYAASVAFEQVSRLRFGTNMEKTFEQFDSLDASKYPLLSQLRKEMISGREERFYWGLEVQLNGLLNVSKGS
ncbi:TetR/AcrR family transcriptional regulator [Paenibacillus sp. TAF58]